MTTHENIDETWPSTNNGENIRWETVKTEEEEYLDKLQTKLQNVMSHAVQSNSRNKGRNKGSPSRRIDVEPDELEGNGNSNLLPLDDDEGLHLLYNQEPEHHGHHVGISEENHIPPGTNTEQSTGLLLGDTPFTPDDNAQQEHVETSDISAAPARPRMVRFRSRVRIGSGIRNISTSSSTCGSASSSISVPLKASGSLAGRPSLIGHPTSSLTEMLTTDATNAWLQGLSSVGQTKRKHPRRNEAAGPIIQNTSNSPTERTALLARVYSYAEPTENDLDSELGRIQVAPHKTEEEVIFGKWPWRLFNRYWWWWRIEWLICCCERFDDESDSDS